MCEPQELGNFPGGAGMAEYGPDGGEAAYVTFDGLKAGEPQLAEPSSMDLPDEGSTVVTAEPDLLERCAGIVDDLAGWGRTGRQPNEWESAGGARLRLTWATGEVTATFLARGWDGMATWQRALHTERMRVRNETGADFEFAAKVGSYTKGYDSMTNQALRTRMAPNSAVVPGEALPVAPFEHGVVIHDRTEVADSGMLPTRAHDSDAGLDLYTVGDWFVEAGAWVDIPCGIRMQLPSHVWGMITGRSSTLRKLGLLVPQSVIDPGYRGPLFVQVWNLGQRGVLVKDKQRVGQMILIPNVTPLFDPVWVEAVEDSDRGGNGFGSSGN